jgi:hypothetical protein
MKSLIFAALFALSLPFAAHAKTYPIPDEDPVATVTLPDSWDADDLDDGVEVTSPDEAVYVAVEAADLLDVKSATVEAFKFFDEKGITIDKSSQKEHEFEVGGMKAFELGFKGKDEDGPTNVSITVVTVSEKKVLMITYWASDEGEKNNADGLSKIINSIQATKK